MEQESMTQTVSDTTPTGIELVACYVDDYQKGLDFYTGMLGLVKLYDMGESSCYLKLGEDSGIYLEGGNQPSDSGVRKTRASFVMKVGSAFALFDKLRDAGSPIVQAQPMNMGNDQYWFQFSDPAGNILEVVGGK